MTLATIGVLVTALITAPVAKYSLGIGWAEALLIGAVVASTDAAAVFLLIHSRGLRLRPRVSATLEVEVRDQRSLCRLPHHHAGRDSDARRKHADANPFQLGREAVLGTIIGIVGGRLVVMALNRVALPQGLHAPFVATSALAIFGLAQVSHASGFLAVYLAGMAIGNRPTRAHNTVVVFLDAVTWLAQIVMFVLLGLLAWPHRLVETLLPALAIAAVLMLVARPVAVFLCLAPFRFPWREKTFIAWVGLRGAVAIFLPRFRSWSALPMPIFISMSPSWW